MMNSEVSATMPEAEEDESDALSEEELADTAVLAESESKSTDNVGDVSVEINVEQLIADIESEKDKDTARKKEVRMRLEEIAEKQSLEDTFAMEFDSQD
jgi:hypothetical protein